MVWNRRMRCLLSSLTLLSVVGNRRKRRRRRRRRQGRRGRGRRWRRSGGGGGETALEEEEFAVASPALRLPLSGCDKEELCLYVERSSRQAELQATQAGQDGEGCLDASVLAVSQPWQRLILSVLLRLSCSCGRD